MLLLISPLTKCFRLGHFLGMCLSFVVPGCLSAATGGENKPGLVNELGPLGQPAVISLTYDDAIAVHHQKVAPFLSQHGARGTFYLTVKNIDDPAPWQAVAEAGHELGNHSLFHPCRREPKENYAWLPEYYDLVQYDLNRLREELRIANRYIDFLDGVKARTYGNTCLHKFVGPAKQPVSIDPLIDEMFIAARGSFQEGPIFPSTMNVHSLGHYNGDGRTFEQLKQEVEQATANGGWLIYLFHGVGKGTHPLFIAEQEHRKFVQWLAVQPKRYWVAPVADVVQRFERLNNAP